MLFVAILALVIGAFGASAYRGVRDSAILRASERLASIARELGTTAYRAGLARLAVLQDVARNPEVARLLSTPAVSAEFGGDVTVREMRAVTARDSSARRNVDAVLAARRTPADSTLMDVQLWTASGTRVYGKRIVDGDSARLADVMRSAFATDSITRSPLYAVGSQIRLWTVVPVKQGQSTIGFLAEQRFVGGSAQAEQLIAKLTGEDVHVYYGSRGSNEWASIRGLPVRSPIGRTIVDSLRDTGPVRYDDAPGGPAYAASGTVAGTPWRIVLVQSEASILAPPHAFLRELLLIGAVLLLLGTVAAWWLSRLETRPLRDLRRAAEAMAGGDYGQAVVPAGGAETAALADAFNTMSMHISGTHATLAERNALLVEANEAKARFLAVMSHELRTPLNAIGGHAELLALGVHGPVTDAQRDAMERIRRSKEQLLHLVSDILHYSRIEASPMPLTRTRVSLSEVFDVVRDNVVDQFRRKAVALRMDATTATVFADEVRMQQILSNLVINALQFTPTDGRVTVSARSDANWTTIEVSDTGVGIAPDMQASIFEPFVQVDDSLTRRSGGAGLGLAIVRQLVTAMAGTVTVKSEAGCGATFVISLPSEPEFSRNERANLDAGAMAV
ncbi:MAG: HAMP domain-containing histidine kinase [Gemmatimonadaceae bacterium]|nr:HAMP domain-containing histidine kinase [Gemmatimonadaceae bacterium]